MQRWFISLLTCLLLVSAVMAQENTIDTSDVLENYAGTPTDLLLELEIDGIIPSGAQEIFAQATLNYGGNGAQFSNFATDSTVSNFVMGATLTLNSTSDALEYCGIAGRTLRTENNRLEDGSNITTIRLDSYLAIGIDNSQNVFAFEFGEEATSELALIEDTLTDGQSVAVLAVVLNDVLTVYVEGVPVLTDYAVNIAGGAFAMLYAGASDDSTCRAESVFAYSIPDNFVETCEVSTDRVINRRAGPGTNFEILAQFTGAETLIAVGQTIGADGFVWWVLEDGTWARNDVVNTVGFCRALPEVDVEGI